MELVGSVPSVASSVVLIDTWVELVEVGSVEEVVGDTSVDEDSDDCVANSVDGSLVLSLKSEVVID